MFTYFPQQLPLDIHYKSDLGKQVFCIFLSTGSILSSKFIFKYIVMLYLCLVIVSNSN